MNKRRPSHSSAIRIALETRMMFDGAAVVTADAAAHAPAVAAAAAASNAAADAHAADAHPAEAPHAAPAGTATATAPAAADHSADPNAPHSSDAPADANHTAPASTTGDHHDPADALHDALTATAPVDASHARQEIFFVDSSLPDLNTLVASLPAHADIVYLNSSSDGLTQIAAALQGRENVDAIHIITHATEGAVIVGDSILTTSSIEGQYHDILAEIGSHMSSTGDVLIYGCDFAAGSDGATAVEALAHALNTDVAASTDTTGVDGNWVLEDQVGTIETTAIQATDWHHDLLLAANDTFTAYVGTGNVLNVLANDGLSGVLPVVTIASGPSHGTVVVNADGTITYTPTANTTFTTDSFSYTAKLAGLLGTTATVTLNLDKPPVVIAPATVSGNEDSTLTLSGANLISVSDADNTSTTLTLSVPAGTLTLHSSTGLTFIQGAVSGSSTVTVSGTIANVNAALNGLIYTPVADANSTLAAPINLTVTAVDSLLGTATSTIGLVLAPVADAVTDTVVTKQSTPASFNVLANDTFSNAGRIVTGFSAPAHGVVTIDAQGNAVYTPNLGYSGTDTFTYTVTSGGSTETGTVNVTTLLNYAPTITAPSATQVFNEDVARVFSSANGNAITVADANNDILTVTVASTHGSLTLSQTTGLTFISGTGLGDTSMVLRGTAAAINAALNGLQFTPVLDYNGSALVSVQASDGIAAVQSASVALSLTPVADGVVDNVSTGPLAPVTFSPLANDSFAAGAVITSISNPGHGLAVLLNNTVTYTPALGYTGSDTFTYTVTSGGVTETIAINVVVGDTAPTGPASLGTIATVDKGLIALTPGLAFHDADLLDVLKFTATGLPAGLTIDPLLGTITGVVDGHASVNGVNGTGTYNIVVTATDLAGKSASSTLTMTVTNPAPIPLLGLSVGGSENALLGIGLNALAIVDPDGDAFSITNATAQHGTVTIKADGSLSYQPNANYYGADTITYTVKDVDGGTATGYVAVLLAQVPTLPILNLPSLSLPLLSEDTPLVFANLLGQQLTVGNVDGDALTINLDVPLGVLSINNLTEHGAVTISQHTDASGANTLTLQGSAVDINAALADLVYTPAADYNGPLAINIGLGKLLGGIINVTASLPITIAPVADIVDDNVNATLNTSASFNVLANDTFENAGRVVSSHTNPTHGTVTIDAQGNAVYTPTTGYLGVDSFTYTVTSNGTTETATVHINTALPNYAPTVSSPSTATVNEDTTQVFSSANGNAITVADANNDVLTVTLSTTHGTLTLQQTTGLTFTSGDGNADASMVLRGSAADINAALNGLKFTPDADYNGAAAITVSASDGLLNQSNNIAVAITSVPDAITDNVQTSPLAPVTFYPLANDTFSGTPTITGITQGAHGLVVLGLNGAVTYTPALGYTGTDSFTYTVTTASGIVETGTVNVTVGNHAPVSNGNLGTLPVLDAQLVVAVPTAQAFTDADPLDVLHYSATGLPAGLTINPLTGLIGGTVDGHASVNGINNTGTYNVVVTATDSAGATATSSLVVQVTNPAPVPLVGLQVTGSEDLPIDITAAALGVVDPDHDALTITGATALHGTVTINADGSLRYTPNANYNGLDTITYQVKDTDGGMATGYVAVVVAPVVDLPTIQLPQAVVLAEDTPLIFANIVGQHLTVGNVDGDLLDIKLSVPLGLLKLTDTTGISLSEGSSTGSTVLHFSGTTAAINAALNSLVYTPGADYNGPLNININLAHVTGGIADVNLNLPITIAAVADIVPDNVTTVTNTAVSFNVLANDTFENAGRIVYSHSNPTNGTVTIDAQGNAVYTPGTGFTGSDSFTYTVQSNGTFETTTVTIAINTAPDANPVATPIGNRAGTDGQGVNIDVHSYFSDPDGDTLTYSATGLPTNVQIDPSTGIISGTLGGHASTDVASGAYAIVVTASDGRGGLVSQSFTLNVVNPAPTPVDDAFSGDKNTTISGNVLTNDTDPDHDALHIDTTPVQVPANGTLVLNANGTFVYTPNNNFHGTDSFQYRVIDADGGTATATVVLTVNQTNQAPVTSGTIANQTGTDASNFNLSVAGKFTDADGDTLTYTASGLPTGLSISANGVISGPLGGHASTGGPNNDGVYTVTVTASDGNGGTVSENFTLSVLNPAPVITTTTPNPSTNEDTVLNGQVSASDADGDNLTYSATSQPTHGTLVFNADGTYRYTPAANFNGTDSFTYKVADTDGGVATATVTITVNPVNDAPVAVGTIGAQSGVDAAPFSLNIANRFSDVDGDTLSYSSTTLPTGLSIDANGNITGNLGTSASHGGPNGNGIYTITITANDGHGGTVDQSFTLAVVNPVPVTSNSAVTTAEDTPYTGTVTATDDDAVSFSVATGPSHGTLTFNANGTYTYTPASNFNGTDTFTYTVTDADNATAQATVTLTVTPVNDAPVVASPIGTQAGTDHAPFNLSVANNFSDVDGDTLSFSASGLPTGLSIDASGNISGTLGTSASTQGINGTGQYNVSVSATDGHGGLVTQTFVLNVGNLAPTASNSTLTINEDNVATGNLLASNLASDPDGDALHLDTTPVTAPQHGSLTLNADGTYLYTPNSNYNGSDSFSYRVIDADGAAVTATVSITINPVNDAPVAQGTISAQNANDGSLFSLNVGGNFSDVDNPTLTYTVSGLPTGLSIDANGLITGTLGSSASQGGDGHGVYTVTVSASDGSLSASQTFTLTVVNLAPVVNNSALTLAEDSTASGNLLTSNAQDPDGDVLHIDVTPVTAPAHGTLTLSADGTFLYTPTANFNGTDSFSYRVIDADGAATVATVTLNVTPVYDAPQANGSIPAVTANDHTSLSIGVAGNFSDADGTALTYSAVGLPAGVSIDPSTGLISGTLNSSASVQGPGGHGIYTVQVSANDGFGGTATQTFTITAVNTVPTAGNGTVTLAEDSVATGTLLNNASDTDGDTLSFVATSQPTHGTLVLNANGTYTYTPAANFNGTDSFNYRVSDPDGGSTTATLTFTVTPVYDAPVAGAPIAAQTANDGSAVSLNVAGNFSDADGTALVYSASGLPAGLSINATTGLITGTLGSSASHQGPNGDGTYTVQVSVSDGLGGSASQSFTFSAINTLPVASNATVTLAEDTPATFDLRANASDADGDALTIVPITQPAHGSLTLNANGTYTYNPAANFNGTDSFNYRVTDADGATTTATITFNVTPVYDAPAVATPVANQSANDGSAISLNVAGNFTNPDNATLVYSAANLPNGLTINASTGLISGTLNSSASHQGANNGGDYAVVISVFDGTTTVSQAFTLTAVNTIPVAGNASVTLAEDTSATLDLRANASDADGDALTIVPATQPAHGSLTLNGDGTYTYTPAANFNGTDSFTYRVTDADGASTTATVTLNITPVYDAPAAGAPIANQSANDGSAVSLNVAGNFSDADGRALTYSATGLPTGITLDPNTGLLSGTLNSSASHQGANNGGNYSIVITASDGLGGSATQSFVLTAVNTLPVAGNTNLTLAEDTSATLDLRANASDADGDALTIVPITQPAHGSLTLNADGTYTYTPAANFNGTDSFNYRVTDADGATTTATVTFSVTPVYDAPQANGTLPALTANDSSAINLNVAGAFTDADGRALSYSGTGLPTGITLDPTTGLLSGTLNSSASTQGANNGGNYSIVITASDGLGGTVSQSFTLTAINTLPTAAGTSLTLAEDSIASGDLHTLASDADGDNLIFTSAQDPAHGTLVINPNGTYTYTPNANFNGTDSFSYRVTDADGATTVATIALTITPVYDAPTPVGTIATQTVNDAATFNLAVASSFADADGATLTYSATGLPAGVTIDPASGLISGTLGNNASTQGVNGTSIYNIQVSATDGTTLVSQSFDLHAVNLVPTTSTANISLGEGQTTTGNFNNYASDADHDTLNFSLVQGPANGTLTFNAGTGAFTYTPGTNYTGADSITYRVTDTDGGTTTGVINFNVLADTGGPVASGTIPTLVTNDHTNVTVSVANNFTDSTPGATLTYSATGLPQGLAIDTASGLITGTLNSSASTQAPGGGGSYTVVVTANDGAGGTATQTFTLTAVNTLPQASNALLNLNEDGVATGNLNNYATDADGDVLTFSTVQAPAHGTLTLDAVTGAYTYTPNANFNGSDSFIYQVTDADGGFGRSTVITIVAPQYDGPLPNGSVPSISANDHSNVTLNLANSFSDADNTPLQYSATGLPTGLSIDPATGILSGQLASSASTQGVNGTGTYNVVITATDGTTSASQAFTLTAVNTLPVAGNSTVTLAEDSSAQVDLRATSSDADGDNLTIVPTSQPAHGSLTLNADGLTYTYTPNANFNGSDSFSYRVTDADGAVSNGVISFNVTPVYDAPVAVGSVNNLSANDHTTISLNVAGNFSDADNATLTYSATGLPTGVTIDAQTGLISGQLGTSASIQGINGTGTYNVVISASDGTSIATQAFTLTAFNTVPVAGNITVPLSEDGSATFNLGANASDADGDVLTSVPTSQPAHGTLTLNANGSYTYTPAANFNGTDSFTYQVSDPDGGHNTATVTFNVAAVYDAPAANGTIATQTANDGSSLSLSVAGNFTNVDNATLTYSATGLPTGVSIDPATGLISGTLGSSASHQGVNGSGNYSVVVQVTDGTSTVAQNFTLVAVNTVPTANNGNVTLAEDSIATGNLNSIATDTDGDALSFSAASQPQHGVLLLNTNGSYSYQPVANFNGTDSFNYTVTDADGASRTATLTFTVTPVYDAPVATAPINSFSAADHSSVNVNVAGHFTSPDNLALSYSASNLPNGLSIDPATGLITGTLNSSASSLAPGGGGSYTVTVSAFDGTTTVSQQFVLTAVNTVPTASNATVTLAEDTPTTGDLKLAGQGQAQDADADALTFTTVTGPAHGQLTLNADGTYSYTPAPNFNGSDSFTYRVSDPDGGSTTATLTFNVTPVYDGPSAGNPIPTLTANDHSSVSTSVAGNFNNPDNATLTYSASGLPAGLSIDPSTGLITGTLGSSASHQAPGGSYSVVVSVTDGTTVVDQTFNLVAVNTLPTASNATLTLPVGSNVSSNLLNYAQDADGDVLSFNATTLPTHGTLTLNVNGSFTYTPTAGYSGADTLTYTVTDADGASTSATLTFNISAGYQPPSTVGSVAPISADDHTSVSLNVAGNFSDTSGNTLTYTATGLPAGLNLDPATGLLSGTLNTSASTQGVNGSGTYNVVITASDGIGGSAAQSFTLTAVNTLPVASGATLSTNEDTPATGDLRNNATDADGDALTFTTATGPAHGVLVLNTNGTYTYTPAANYNGSDSFTYTVTDADGAASTATIAITVAPVYDAPTTTPITTVSANDHSSVNVGIAGNFSSPDNLPLTYTASGLPAGLSLDPSTGVISGTLNSSASIQAPGGGGNYSVIVFANDGTTTVSQTFTLTAVNTLPTTSNASVTLQQGTTLNASVAAFASDADGDALSFSTAVPPAHGVLTISANGSYTYTPIQGYVGQDSFTYRVTDADGGISTGVLTLNVSAQPDNAPVVSTPLPTQTATDGGTFTLNVANSFSDPDGDTLTYSANGLPPGLTLNPATGLITGTLPNNASGQAPGAGGVYTVTLTASDGTASVSQVISLVVNNPLPVTTGGAYTLPEDSSVSGVLTATDPDGDAISFAIGQAPSHGSLTLNANGTFTYTPNANYSGADQFTYQVRDSDGGVTSAVVTFNITPVNDAPVSTPGNTTVGNGGPSTIDVIGNVSDPDGDPLTVTGGSAGHGSVVVNPNGTVTYTPTAGYTGADVLTYTVSDGKGGSTSGSIAITVTAAPVVTTTADGFIAPPTAVFGTTTAGIPPSYSTDGAGTYQRVAHYDPVLLDAVNGVKRLGGLTTIDEAAPMDDVVASLQPLGNSTAIDTNQAPMAAATGDLQEQNRQQINVDDLRAGPLGTGAPNTTPAAAAEPAEQATPPQAVLPAEPAAQQGDNGNGANTAQGNVTAIPLTLNEQLQAASQQRVAEREALAKLLAS